MIQPLPTALTAWLRRANRHPIQPRLLLSGSALIAALCPGARVPHDLDYVVAGAYDVEVLAHAIRDIAATADRSGEITVGHIIDIAEYDERFPGLRVDLTVADGAGKKHFLRIDFTTGDPLTLEPRLVPVQDVGSVLAVAPESLFAWKVHALVQFGGWDWRPKDIYDLHALWNEARLDRAALPAAIDVAFSSRGSTLDELDDLRKNPEWGLDSWNKEMWEDFAADYGVTKPFETYRAELRAMLDDLLGA